MSEQRIAAVLLAAGGSSRFGDQPKQLAILPNGKTLLQNAIDQFVQSRVDDIVVVLGASVSEIIAKTNFGRASYVINSNWEAGMAGSIRTGLSMLNITGDCADSSEYETSSNLDAVLLAVADQPEFSSAIVEALLDSFQSNRMKASIACSSYSGAHGVPCLFGREHFSDLLALEGETGAKRILSAHPDRLVTVEFSGGVHDVDYPSDLPRD